MFYHGFTSNCLRHSVIIGLKQKSAVAKERGITGTPACCFLILKLVTGVHIPQSVHLCSILFGNLSVVSAEILFFCHLLGIIVTVVDRLRNLSVVLSTCCGMVSACMSFCVALVCGRKFICWFLCEGMLGFSAEIHAD